MLQSVAVPVPAVTSVAKTVAVVPTFGERLLGSTALARATGAGGGGDPHAKRFGVTMRDQALSLPAKLVTESTSVTCTVHVPWALNPLKRLSCPTGSEPSRTKSRFLLLNAGTKLPVNGAAVVVWFRSKTAESSITVLTKLAPLVILGRKMRSVPYPFGPFSITDNSPTDGWVRLSTRKSRSAISTSSVIVNVSVTPARLAFGIDRPPGIVRV